MPETQKDPIQERLDDIVLYLEKMDRRDHLRMIGGFFKSIIALIPIAIVVWSSWYFYAHSDEILSKITSMATKQAIQQQVQNLKR